MKRSTELFNQSSDSKKQCDKDTPPTLHNPILSSGAPIGAPVHFSPPINNVYMNQPKKSSPMDRLKSIFNIHPKYSSHKTNIRQGGYTIQTSQLLSAREDYPSISSQPPLSAQQDFMDTDHGNVGLSHTSLSHVGVDHMMGRGNDIPLEEVDVIDAMDTFKNLSVKNRKIIMMSMANMMQAQGDDDVDDDNEMIMASMKQDVDDDDNDVQGKALKDIIIARRQQEVSNNERLFCYNNYDKGTNTQAGGNNYSSHAYVPVIEGIDRQQHFYESLVARPRQLGRPAGLAVATVNGVVYMYQKDPEHGKEASQGRNRTGLTVHSDSKYTMFRAISNSPKDLPIAPYSETNKRLLKLLDDYIRFLVKKFGCTDSSMLRYHIITYLQGDATGEHADGARKEDLKRGIAMRLIIRTGGSVVIKFSAKKHGPNSKRDSEGEPYDIGFELCTKAGFDMYMMVQNSSGVSFLCHTDKSMKYGIQAFHSVKSVGLKDAGSAAIVVDFTVESPEKAKRALEIMRTEDLDLPDDLQEEWEKLSFLKENIMKSMSCSD